MRRVTASLAPRLAQAKALAAATLERVAKLATAEIPALSVESAFAEEGFEGTVETVTPRALPFLAEAAGYAEGMSFDVHRWRLV